MMTAVRRARERTMLYARGMGPDESRSRQLGRLTRISRKQKAFEHLKNIEVKHSAELTHIGERLSSALEQYRIDDVYSILDGDEGDNQSATLQHRFKSIKGGGVGEGMRLSIYCRSSEATAIVSPSATSHFNLGLESGSSKVAEALTARDNVYQALHNILQFLISTFGTFRVNGNTLVLDNTGDSETFRANVNRLYEAGKVWHPGYNEDGSWVNLAELWYKTAMKYTLTLHEEAWGPEGPVAKGGDVIGYYVGGIPPGEEAKIHNHDAPGNYSRVMRIKHGKQGDLTGQFGSAEDTLAWLQTVIDREQS